MKTVPAWGWWTQPGFGRQPMRRLILHFDGARLIGSGVDIVAPFELDGRLGPGGRLEMIKQYVDRHRVLYVGQYDGEGTFSGTWDIDGMRGAWMIRLGSPIVAADAAIEEFHPRPE